MKVLLATFSYLILMIRYRYVYAIKEMYDLQSAFQANLIRRIGASLNVLYTNYLYCISLSAHRSTYNFIKHKKVTICVLPNK